LHAVANNANAITRINRATVSTPTRKTALFTLCNPAMRRSLFLASVVEVSEPS
jgi:hypothetical protein